VVIDAVRECEPGEDDAAASMKGDKTTVTAEEIFRKKP